MDLGQLCLLSAPEECKCQSLFWCIFVYKPEKTEKQGPVCPWLTRGHLVDYPSCGLGTCDMKRNLHVLFQCSCLSRDTCGPWAGVLSRPQGVKKAARQGTLCSVWELLALHGLELPPDKQFYFCSAPLPLKQLYSFYSGNYLPLFLCIHQLFMCCWICNCSWCHSWI